MASPAREAVPQVNAALADELVGRRVIRGGAARAIAYVAANLVAAVAAMVLLRQLGVDGFGRYATVMAVIAIMQIVTDAGLTVTGTHQLALQPTTEGRRRLQREIVTLRLVLSLAGLAVAVAVTLGLYGGSLAVGAALAGTGTVLFSVQSALILPLAVEMRNTRLGVNEILRNTALLVGAVVAAAMDASLRWFFAVQFFAGVAVMLWVPAIAGLDVLRLRPSLDLRAMRALLRVAVPVAIGSVLSIVYAKVLLIVVSVVGDGYETGVYAAASRIFEIVAALPALLAGVALPVLTVAAHENRDRLRYVARRMTEGMALVGLLLALGIALAAETVVRILGGEEFATAASAVRIQCLALATLFVGNSWGVLALALGRPLHAAGASAVGVVVAVVAGVILVPLRGADGAALAMVIADAALLAVMGAVLARGGLPHEVTIGFLVRTAVAIAAGAGVGVLIGRPPLLAAAAGGLVFVALAFTLRIVPSELSDELGRRRRA